MFAPPAGATTGCSAGEFPNTFGGPSELRVNCYVDAGYYATREVIHDATNVDWHHGAARTFTMTGSIVTGASVDTPVSEIHFTGTQITAADIARPINAYDASNAEVFPSGLFISAAPVDTTVPVSQPFTSNVTGPVTATIEYTRNRYLSDVFCHSIDPGNVIVRDKDTVAAGPVMTPTGASLTNTFAADAPGSFTVSAVTMQIPSKGTITILGDDNAQHTLHYTAFTGSAFTIDAGSGGSAHPHSGTGQVAWKSSTVIEFGSGGILYKNLVPKLPTVAVGDPGNLTVATSSGNQVFTYVSSTSSPNYEITGLNDPSSGATISPGAAMNWTLAKASAVSTLTLAPPTANNGWENVSDFASPALLEDSAGISDGTISWTGTSGPGGRTLTGVTITGTGVGAGATLKQAYKITEGSTRSDTLSSASANFTSSDVGKSVSGGPFGAGVYISAIDSATQVTLTTVDGSDPIPGDCTKNGGGNFNSPHIVASQDSSSAGTDAVEIGSATYEAGIPHAPELFPGADPMSVELNNDAESLNLTGVSSTIATSLFNKTAHGLTSGDIVSFFGLTNTTGVTLGTNYYVVNATASTFQVSATIGGAAITLGGTTDAAIQVFGPARVAFACSGSTLTLSGAAIADYGGITGAEVGLPVSVTSITGTTVSGTVTAATAPDTITMSVACPAGGVTPTPFNGTFAYASIGGPSAGGPNSGDAMATVAGQLNMNSSIVADQNDCQPASDPAKSTFEPFQLSGGWTPPGPDYSASRIAPIVSTAQVAFATSIITFLGYVVPQKSGADGAFGGKAHYNVDIPDLPISAGACLNDTISNHGVPWNPMQFVVAVSPTTITHPYPGFAVGTNGDTGDPIIRRLLPVTTAFATANPSVFGSAFHQMIDLQDQTGAPVGASPFAGADCTISDPTVLLPIDPTTCGDG